MKRSAISYLGLALGLLLTAGCAGAYRIDYSNISPDLSATGTKSVAVGTLDQREYVVTGKKKVNFVGIVRGGYGNPFNLSTKSGKPLAEDMSEDITGALSEKGFKAQAVQISSTDTQSAAIQKLKAAGADRMVLLIMNEWKTDTYMAAQLYYNLDVKVLDRNGNTLASKKTDGSEHLGTSAMNPAGVARKRAPIALKEKIEAVMNSPEIVRALR